MTKEYFDRLFVEACGESKPFGSDTTYALGAEFIGQLPVEDWGCGLGWYRRFAQGPYKGIDASWSPFADEVVDLCEYRSQTPAIFMRNVLEYNPSRADRIIENALASFTNRMMIVTTADLYLDHLQGISLTHECIVGENVYRLTLGDNA